MVYGAAPIPPELLRRTMGLLQCSFYQGYGLTEGFCATSLRPRDHDVDDRPELLASAGRDSLSWLVRIVGPDGAELPSGEQGEVVIRGPALMEGYWHAPEATADVLRNGWFHTGDLGYRSPAGYVYLTDRLKDVIVSGGENISSREVEDALAGHPGVLEAAVIGIPDRQWGESVHAVVVLRASTEVGAEELLEHCRGRLARYKTPKSLEIVDDLPKNAAGKILKRELRRPYWEASGRSIG